MALAGKGEVGRMGRGKPAVAFSRGGDRPPSCSRGEAGSGLDREGGRQLRLWTGRGRPVAALAG